MLAESAAVVAALEDEEDAPFDVAIAAAAVAEADEEAAAEARFRRVADVAADSQFICPLEDVLGTLSVGNDSGEDGIHIFRLLCHIALIERLL